MRRLPLVLVAGLLAALTGLGAWLVVPPTQQSTAAVLFVPSVKQPGVQGPTNPLLSLGNSVSIVASVVQIAVSDDHTMSMLADAGHTAEYEVVPDLGENAGPVLLITVEDVSFSQAQGTRDALVAEIRKNLTLLQDERHVPEDLRVSAVVLTASSEGKPIHKPQIQAALLSVAGTMVALLLIILQLERRAERGRRHGPAAHALVSARQPNDGNRAEDEGDERRSSTDVLASPADASFSLTGSRRV
jgi:hypothetical protein